MRVLWFSVTAACYSSALTKGGFNGGGWVSSLEKIIKCHPEYHLGIAFEFQSDKFKDTIDGVDYYPIHDNLTLKEHFRREYTLSYEEKILVPAALRVIEDFKPDIIQCFGTEWPFGLVAQHIDIPVIIHMQGSYPSYFNALYPPRYNKWTKLTYEITHFHIKDVIRALFVEKKGIQRTEREFRIMKVNKYFFGRTDWDRSITNILSPNSMYFVGNEALRDSFYYSNLKWTPKYRDEISICTTGNGTLWKGLDVVLKAASILKSNTNLRFKWKIIGGVSNVQYIEWMENLKFSECNIKFAGVLDENHLRDELLNCDIYVHPAYIDNSPNALCEAMFLGCPCIASNAGGVSSILSDKISGRLLPVNEPYYLADAIFELSSDKEAQIKYSKNAIVQAEMRHNPDTIFNEIKCAYNEILSNTCNLDK